jgi:transposase
MIRWGAKETIMPKLLFARPAEDATEERQVRKLAGSRHAPGDWILRAQMILHSWEGWRTTTIADELGCHPQTVRERIARFNAEGVDGLGDRPGPGRRPRLTEEERSTILALAQSDPPGRLVREADGQLAAEDEEGEPHWTLDALTTEARQRGIQIGRSQVRRILKAEGVRWRTLHSWGDSSDPDFVPKGRRSSRSMLRPPRTGRPSAWTSLAR